MLEHLHTRLFIAMILCLAPWSVFSESGFIDSDGVKIHYITEGEGEAIVLIHGFTASAAQNWVAPGIFAELAKSYKVIAIDARGHGKSDKPHGVEHYGIKMIDDIINVMDAMKIEKAHIAGYSMGGFITTKFLIEHPDRVISAVPGGAGWSSANSPETDVFDELAESLESGNGITPLIIALTPEGEPKPTQEYLDAINRMLMATNDAQALASVIRSMSEFTVTDSELKNNKIPTTVIVGTKDPLIVGVKAMEKVMSNLTAIYVEGEDHMSLIGKKEYLNGMLNHINAHSDERART